MCKLSGFECKARQFQSKYSFSALMSRTLVSARYSHIDVDSKNYLFAVILISDFF